MGGPKQKGITTYSVSPFRQRALAGSLHGMIFNSARRVKGQILYIGVPFSIAYLAYSWAKERNEFYNSKAGHAAGFAP